MNQPAPLPAPAAIRVFGRGASRTVRALYRERCSVQEIAAFLKWPATQVRHTLRWKAGRSVW